MWSYLVRRLVQAIFILFIITMLCFILTRLSSDPMSQYATRQGMTDADRAVRDAAAQIPAEVCARFETADKLSDEDRKTTIEIARKALACFQPKLEAKPDEPDQKTEKKTEPEAKAGNKSEPKPNKTTPESESKPEQKAESKPDGGSKPEAQTKPKPESKIEPESKPESEPKAKPKLKAEPKPDGESKPEAKPETEPKAKEKS